jgi:hypothetical protein
MHHVVLSAVSQKGKDRAQRFMAVSIKERNYFHREVKEATSEEVIFELKLERNKEKNNL